MNLLIALMQDTYQAYRSLERGLFYKTIITCVPCYKYDSVYGCLISLPPPLNILKLIFLPCFMLSGDIESKKKANRLILMVIYFPIGAMATIFFVILNFLYLPLAYSKALLHKSIIVRKTKTSQAIFELLSFSAFGFFIMLAG